ncbi:BQ2448_2792 [Microbotryum intermedium]|uniref:BQ2448_2792 protein n=1 Tax=Microbotryum intermedium TaxID=269621 RepID=A0A238FH32_9BASI|nr:BQ2448_2792 [Microbotryum intermedium]
MDVDTAQDATSQVAVDARANQTRRAASPKVVVNPDDPYDLEQVTGNYHGRTKIIHLLYIAQMSPSLAAAALTLALQELKASTLDVPTYEQTFHHYRQVLNSLESGESNDAYARGWYEQTIKSGAQKAHVLDREWCERSKREASNGLEKLQVELKGYSTNLIKESIRMGHRDLARFQYKVGDLTAAEHSYLRAREFCLTSQHLLEMSVAVVEIALLLRNYSLVRQWSGKAEGALESIHSSANAQNAKQKPQVNLPGMVAPAQDPAQVAREKERIAMQERLNVANGVAYLGQGTYDRAAFLLSGGGKEALHSAAGHFIPAADIAVYATLTGLATFNRNQLRTRLLENDDLRPMLELEPYLREIIQAFHSSNFKDGLEGLDKYSTRQRLDPHLAPHLPNLMHQIRSRALLVYFTPFASVSVPRFAAAFGWSESTLLESVVELIGQGQMKARVDSQNKVLVAKQTDPRVEAFKHALKEGEKMQRCQHAAELRCVDSFFGFAELTMLVRADAGFVRLVMYRVKLIQANIVVKPSRGQGGNTHQASQSQGQTEVL